jgi:hypothetical protein
MLLVPLLIGVAASRPAPWHLVLAGAALTAYLASASVQAWTRARRPRAYRAPIAAYGGLFAILGLTLVVAFPALLLTLVVAGPAAALVLGGARPGTRRDLANSLAQVVQALVLVPAAAWVSGSFEAGPVVTATAVAAGYLIGTVLVVRSVLRERGNEAFAALSVGFHVVLVGLALAALPLRVLPPVYGVVAAALALRALALPMLQRRLAAGPRPLRPIHVGLVEIAASIATVAVVFFAPP